ncbi:hypothetical protein [Spiroplasma endosymbiont of Stenodema calcarata]|uniref:hypothetical protein n=1 Tax=Spiroplasma endosymbiont of Stenodema calcarata TaxID=3139328 RepID=UPI003CCAF26C
MTITESIKFNKVKEENETLKKELAEKDKEIESAESRIESAYEKILIEKDKQIKNLEKEWKILVCDKYDLQQTQLFKEDFGLTCYAECNCDGDGCGYGLIDNSKYNKLPSKDVK